MLGTEGGSQIIGGKNIKKWDLSSWRADERPAADVSQPDLLKFAFSIANSSIEPIENI